MQVNTVTRDIGFKSAVGNGTVRGSTADKLRLRITRMIVALKRWRTEPPLRQALNHSTDDVLDRALARAGMQRADLFMSFSGNAPHRKRMAAMMLCLGVDREHAADAAWDEMRAAERRCTACPDVGRCERLLQWRFNPDMARRFCPNAALFEHLAQAQSTTD